MFAFGGWMMMVNGMDGIRVSCPCKLILLCVLLHCDPPHDDDYEARLAYARVVALTLNVVASPFFLLFRVFAGLFVLSVVFFCVNCLPNHAWFCFCVALSSGFVTGGLVSTR